MDDTPEMIRHEMDQTSSQLSQKLESLESQVSQSVQSAGSAVNATVESVRETVETVTEALQSAAQSFSNALNVQRHVDKHPWLIVGGAVVVGFLAAELLTKPAKGVGRPLERAPEPSPAANESPPQQIQSETLASGGAPDKENTFWQQLGSAAVSPLMIIVQDVATRATPLVVEYLSRNRTNEQSSRPVVAINTESSQGANGQRKQLDTA